MNEDIMDSTEISEEIGISPAESLNSDKVDGSDSLESVSNSFGSDSLNDGTSDAVDHYDEDMGAYPVYIIDSTEEADTFSEDDLMLSASYTDYYSYLPTQIEDYFSGVLANMKDTDYVAFAYRHYNSDSYNSYVDYYRLIYDVELSEDSLVSGTYPCIEVSRSYDYSSSYNQIETTYELTSVPDFAYGSFGHLSDLRKGVSHDETYTFLFFAGFAVCSFVLHNLFGFFNKSR